MAKRKSKHNMGVTTGMLIAGGILVSYSLRNAFPHPFILAGVLGIIGYYLFK